MRYYSGIKTEYLEMKEVVNAKIMEVAAETNRTGELSEQGKGELERYTKAMVGLYLSDARRMCRSYDGVGFGVSSDGSYYDVKTDPKQLLTMTRAVTPSEPVEEEEE